MRLYFAFLLVLPPGLFAATEFGFISQLPGNGASSVSGIARDRDGNYLIVGRTYSTDLPATGFQKSMGGSSLASLGGAGYTTLRTPRPGSSNCVAAGWKHPGTLYVSNDSRIYASSDGGATWTGPGAGLPSGGVCSSIAMDSAESGLLYVSYLVGGVYRSTDGGLTWTRTGADQINGASKVLVDPCDSSHVVVSGGTSVWNSGDGGSTWQATASLVLYSVAFDAGRRGVLFGSNPVDGRVYRSGDGGTTWGQVNRFPGSPQYGVVDIAVDPNHSGTVFAAASFAGVYRSRDDGQTWQSVSSLPGSALLAMDPRTSTFYVSNGDGSISRSVDGGTTLTRAGLAPVTPLQMALAPEPANPAGTVLYLGQGNDADAYVAKYSPVGALLWVTYLGGSGRDEATAVSVDGQGSVFVGGITASPQFPLGGGSRHLPDPAATGGGFFVAKIAGDGGRLIYSAIVSPPVSFWTPISIAGIAVDEQGAIYAGEANFVGNDRYLGPIYSSSVLKLNPELSAIGWQSDLTKAGQMKGLAMDATGNVWAAGVGSLWKIDASGGTRQVLTMKYSVINAVTIDGMGRPVIAGVGYPGYASDLPIPPNAFQSSVTGYDPPPANYVAVIDPASGNVISSSLLAGESIDTASAIGLDSQGRILVGGATQSASFPMRQPVQGPFNASTGFLTRFNAGLIDGDVSTFAGDRRRFSVTGLTVDSEDNLIFVGNTLDQNSGEATAAFLAQLKIGASAGDLRLDAVLNAASRLASPVVAGEMVALPGDSFRDDAQVFFDDTAAQIVFHNWKEIRVIAPASLAGRSETRVRVEAGGQVSGSILMPVAAASPGIFTAGGSGWTFALAWDASGAPVLPGSPVHIGSQVVIAVNGVPPGTTPTVTTQSGNPVRVVGAERGTRPDLPSALLLRVALDDSIGPLPPFLSVSVPGATPSRFVPLAVVP